MRYCFDIDGTIFYTNEFYDVVGINRPLIENINKLYDDGNVIIIQTGRHWDKLEMTKQQLEKYDVSYHSLVMGKPTADVYVDDKAVRPYEFKYRI